MIRRLAGMAASTAFAGSLVLTNASCTNLRPADTSLDSQLLASPPAGRQRTVQFLFGKDAAFGACVEPACPVVTQKTLSSGAVASAHPVVKRPDATFDLAAERRAANEFATPSDPPVVPVPSATPTSTTATTSGAAPLNLVIAFPFASADLTDAAKATLSASMREARQSERIVISGRTDGVGDDQVNAALALARALAVRDYLRERIPDLAADISIDAKGRCCFVAPNETQDGRSKNRRVEVVFFSRSDAAWRSESLPQRASVGLDSARDTP